MSDTTGDTTPADGHNPRLSPGDGWSDSVNDLIEAAWGLIANAWGVGNPPVEPTPGWNAAAAAWRARYHEHIARHPEDYCHKCGKPFIPWTAPGPLWNAVMRGGDINGGPEPYLGIVCPSCFAALAEKDGVATHWRFYAVQVLRPLQTVTPSGRVWNEKTWMFNPPPGYGIQRLTHTQVGGNVTQISGVTGDVHP